MQLHDILDLVAQHSPWRTQAEAYRFCRLSRTEWYRRRRRGEVPPPDRYVGRHPQWHISTLQQIEFSGAGMANG